MKHGEKLLICMLAVGALCPRANALTADSSSSPYQGIVDRNIFGLKPPPPPPDPAEANKPQPSKITLTGITTILGNKRALMKTPAAPPKPGEQPKGEQSYILSVGQRDGEIEVMDIDEKAGSVKVNNAGNIVTLTFDKDGVKLTTPAPSAGAPGMPIPSPTGAIPPPFQPGVNPMAPSSPGNFNLPTRNLRLPPAGSASTTTPMGTPGVGTAGMVAPAAYGAGNASLPSFGYSPTIPTPQQQPQVAQMSPEEQIVGIEANREHYKMQNNPLARILPPTPLTSPGSQDSAPVGTGSSQSSTGGNGAAQRPWLQRPPTMPPLPQ